MRLLHHRDVTVRRLLAAVLAVLTVAGSLPAAPPAWAAAATPSARATQPARAGVADRDAPLARPWTPSVRPEDADRSDDADRPSVGSIALVETVVQGVAVWHDPDVEPEVVATAGVALAGALTVVPALTGLPPFSTPIAAYVLADDERFRLALAELAGVRIDLVAEDIGGYTIERDGTMLIFFAAPNVTSAPSAVLGYAHELAHLAVREATRRRPLPQWFNEGYASWIAGLALARQHPAEARLQQSLDRLAVASALHTRGLIPWPDLVTRSQFSRAGVEGLVSLAYGQSTLFVEFLADRHGPPALARFLTGIGGGAGATQAFGAAFGVPFGAESAAFEASLASLKAELPPGLYVFQAATDDEVAVLGAGGGFPGDVAEVELLVNGELVRRREVDLDGAGLLVATIPSTRFEAGDAVQVRVRMPGLGTLTLDPRQPDARALPVVEPVPHASPVPIQAPAQLPRAS